MIEVFEFTLEIWKWFLFQIILDKYEYTKIIPNEYEILLQVSIKLRQFITKYYYKNG